MQHCLCLDISKGGLFQLTLDISVKDIKPTSVLKMINLMRFFTLFREKCEPVIQVIGGQNNENLPPQEMSTGNNGAFKKKYTVNKKRSAQESFDRLRKHVPAIQADPDASQLDVLLEAIQYIQTLRKDLGKDDKQPPQLQQQDQEQHQNHALRDV